MKDGIKFLAAVAAFVVFMNIVAFILSLLFSNWVTGSITFLGTMTALIYALYKIIESELH
jgi:membrane protein implicated in regulation of membrane protease activity